MKGCKRANRQEIPKHSLLHRAHNHYYNSVRAPLWPWPGGEPRPRWVGWGVGLQTSCTLLAAHDAISFCFSRRILDSSAVFVCSLPFLLPPQHKNLCSFFHLKINPLNSCYLSVGWRGSFPNSSRMHIFITPAETENQCKSKPLKIISP